MAFLMGKNMYCYLCDGIIMSSVQFNDYFTPKLVKQLLTDTIAAEKDKEVVPNPGETLQNRPSSCHNRSEAFKPSSYYVLLLANLAIFLFHWKSEATMQNFCIVINRRCLSENLLFHLLCHKHLPLSFLIVSITLPIVKKVKKLNYNSKYS